MTILNVDPITSLNASPPSLHFLEVGVLRIEGRAYTVSIESADPLLKKPREDTLDRIRDLVDLHLNHLRDEGVELSAIVVQQLDENGLSYVKKEAEKEDLTQMQLLSSEVHYEPYNPFADNYSSYPKSLQDASILTVSDIYRSIIASLTKKSQSESEEESASPINTQNPLDEDTPFEPRIEQTRPKQVAEGSEESSEIDEEEELSETEEENIGLLSGTPEDVNQYNQSGIINSIKFQAVNLFSRIWNSLPTLRPETDPINPEEGIAQDEMAFRSRLSSSQRAALNKFNTIKFD